MSVVHAAKSETWTGTSRDALASEAAYPCFAVAVSATIAKTHIGQLSLLLPFRAK